MLRRGIKNNKRNKFIIKHLKTGLFIYELVDGRYVRCNCK